MSDSLRFKVSLLLLMSLLILCLSWVNAVTFSALPLSWWAPLHMFWSSHSDPLAATILSEVRFPRIMAAILTGAGFAVAGVLMQTLTRNPLASPGLFGVNAGAALGVAVASTVWQPVAALSFPLAAIAGGAFAWGVVMLLGRAWYAGSESKQLILAGIAVSALCGATTKAALILSEDQATSVLTWLAGSFAGVGWQDLFRSAPLVVLCLLIAWGIAPQLNLLLLGNQQAKSLGVHLTLIRYAVNVCILILVGACISCVGSVAFVGLIGPHIARFLFGYHHRWLLAGAALTGAILTTSADILSRAIVFPAETPAGAVLALIGAPCFIWLVRKKTR